MSAEELGAIAAGLFEGVMAPLVLGGEMRPAHAIGGRAAAAIADLGELPLDPALVERVQAARVRRARALVPVDAVAPPCPEEWILSAALHDVLQSANPAFAAPLRRRSARRILEVAEGTIAGVGPPRHAGAALSRHTWFARLLEIARTDTVVSFWAGSRAFLGVEPPARLQAWPKVRRVNVVRTPRALLKLAGEPGLADRLADAVAKLLGASPLTDLATCSRSAPPFAWTPATAGLVRTGAGLTLALRALARLPTEEVDAALGRATLDSISRAPDVARAVLDLLAERAIAQASGHLAPARPLPSAGGTPGAFARALGAAVASRRLAVQAQEPAGPGGKTRAPAPAPGPWAEGERRRLLLALEPAAREGDAALASL
ncbi:MAG: hypothetical protein JOZ69_17245 [Myxococcales bacterium]|nr:hypothetical protein [Myxococcales bacterium]